MKYLCTVGEIVEAEDEEEAKGKFLDMQLVLKLEDIDCIEFNCLPLNMENMDANEMVDLIEDCLARNHS